MANQVGIYGLGSMGYGMALSAHRAGFTTYGFDVNPDRVASFIEDGGQSIDKLSALNKLDVVLVVVLNAAQTESVLFGDNGIASELKPGSVVLGCATVPPEFARKLETQCKELGIHYLDSPISGGAVKAAQGKLSIMASGSDKAFEAAGGILDAIAEKVFVLGDAAGTGSAMKAVNQMLAGTHIAIMAEAITFGISQGIEPEKFLDVISQCAGSSWMLENRAPHIIEGDYSPQSAVDIWPKDLGIVLDIAKSAKFSAPITAIVLQQFLAASGAGLGAEDDSAVAKIYARNANIVLPKLKQD